MLREYAIRNFKAISGPESVPIRPITLIFGPNSSGKSSILQSLLMLKQTMDHMVSKETVLLYKGDLVDLGNYREFIYNHNPMHNFSFKATMQIPKCLDDPLDADYFFKGTPADLYDTLNRAVSRFSTYGIFVEFRFEEQTGSAGVSRIELFLGDEPDALLAYENASLRENKQKSSVAAGAGPSTDLRLTSVDFRHSFWESEEAQEIRDNWLPWIAVERTFLAQLAAELKALSESQEIEKETRAEIVQDIYMEVAIEKKLAIDSIKKNILNIPDDVTEDTLTIGHYLPELLDGLEMHEHFFEMYEKESAGSLSLVTLSASYLFRNLLDSILHLGPLRKSPERSFTLSGSRSRYVGTDGDLVSDILVADNELVAKINRVFKEFELGYQLRVSSLADDTSGLTGLYALRLFDHEKGIHVGISDVGFGVSQVLPVIVQSLLSRNNTLLIEQPELHLHPRLQAELGDVFIEGALSDAKNTFIIETHSEHLILRLLRRVRETSEGRLAEGKPPIRPEDLSVVYAQPGKSGTRLIPLRVTEDGEFEDRWPDGFFSDRVKELL